ncbi:MAG TPA: hypothetical protein K8U84_06785 [Paenalcaligenes hominis]|uniref:Uncharacterized protein n=1 Tax=Paenalcaligenes hominis TaxID=643674 RepID=A0A9D2VGK6_9BURK|nr:hypothetical protein [Paenalcaligenes hominis]NJB64375.1 hypothetical protein [Paenalcaligenes hominis]GGE68128.1 hypothetical protein GCM10007278_15270 [Paenalcaligenes hominis]HJH24241.1 hypothetical protein [Paenalcaligenes hominis]
MFWLMSAVLWLCCAVVGGAQAQLLPALTQWPVQWQPIEQWHWQGQRIQRQAFTSSSSALELINQLPTLLPYDLNALALPSNWIVKFFADEQYFLLFLTAQHQQATGWLSSLSFQTRQLRIPAVFDGLYEHKWVMQAQAQPPSYVVLQAHRPFLKSAQRLRLRLQAQGWIAGVQDCVLTAPCEWSKKQERLMIWQEPRQGVWHILWWHP